MAGCRFLAKRVALNVAEKRKGHPQREQAPGNTRNNHQMESSRSSDPPVHSPMLPHEPTTQGHDTTPFSPSKFDFRQGGPSAQMCIEACSTALPIGQPCWYSHRNAIHVTAT